LNVELLDILRDENEKAETLALQNNWILTKSGSVTRVSTVPNKIEFGGEKFIGSFIYKNDVLRSVFLIPIIEKIEIPNYPCKEYQNIKKEYCLKMLRKIYGEECRREENEIEWETPRYIIGIYTITEGKDKYTGGNIRIDMR